jgi:hypothetical protein
VGRGAAVLAGGGRPARGDGGHAAVAAAGTGIDRRAPIRQSQLRRRLRPRLLRARSSARRARTDHPRDRAAGHPAARRGRAPGAPARRGDRGSPADAGGDRPDVTGAVARGRAAARSARGGGKRILLRAGGRARAPVPPAPSGDDQRGGHGGGGAAADARGAGGGRFHRAPGPRVDLDRRRLPGRGRLSGGVHPLPDRAPLLDRVARRLRVRADPVRHRRALRLARRRARQRGDDRGRRARAHGRVRRRPTRGGGRARYPGRRCRAGRPADCAVARSRSARARSARAAASWRARSTASSSAWARVASLAARRASRAFRR